ncbi:MAG: hypothetical protein M9919_06235 [Burkholderiaceae bacterium]|jgi:hypothetical protein|nr:hypothetical protein [Burkholderiaceae bacterium]
MRINYAHLRERSTSGGWIDFAVFEAHAANGTDSGNAQVLARLTAKARAAGQKIDQSVRQALKRHCLSWFPNEPTAWKTLDHAYGLRSELLHEGRPSDLDLLLAEQTRTISTYLRAIYEKEFGLSLRAPTHTA